MTAPPGRSELRAVLFWCARWLLGGPDYHHGPVEVVVRDGGRADVGAALLLRPRPGEEVYDANDGPPEHERLAHLAARLLAAFTSPDELRVLQVIAKRGPIAPKAVILASGVERTKCYVLLSELTARGLVRDAGDGYTLQVTADLWEVLSRDRVNQNTDAA
jgi:hypothetical protein